MEKERIKMGQVDLQSIAILILSELDRKKFLSSDTKYKEANYPFAVMTVYDSLLTYFEVVD